MQRRRMSRDGVAMVFDLNRFAAETAHDDYLREIERDGPTDSRVCSLCGVLLVGREYGRAIQDWSPRRQLRCAQCAKRKNSRRLTHDVVVARRQACECTCCGAPNPDASTHQQCPTCRAHQHAWHRSYRTQTTGHLCAMWTSTGEKWSCVLFSMC